MKFATKFSYLILRKIDKTVATRGSDFKAKMHQIRLRLAPAYTPLGELPQAP